MKKLNASEFTYYTAKAGDLVKGKSKGDMNTGAIVILGAAALAGAVVALGISAAARIITKEIK